MTIQRKPWIKMFFNMLIVALPFVCFADDEEIDPGGDPDGAPIDGGISLLIAAGAAYGAKKLYDVKKRKINTSGADEKD